MSDSTLSMWDLSHLSKDDFVSDDGLSEDTHNKIYKVANDIAVIWGNFSETVTYMLVSQSSLTG